MALALTLSRAPARADYMVVDQANTAWPATNFGNIQMFGPIGQEFRPTRTTLQQVALYTMAFAEGPGALEVKIHAGNVYGSVIGQSNVVALPSYFSGVTLFPFQAPVPLIPYQLYVIEVLALSRSVYWGFGSPDTMGSTYPSGNLIIEGRSAPDRDLWFAEGPLAAPEPSALVLALTSSLGLFGSLFCRRKPA